MIADVHNDENRSRTRFWQRRNDLSQRLQPTSRGSDYYDFVHRE